MKRAPKPRRARTAPAGAAGAPPSPTPRSAYQDALRRLARRDHSEHELRAALCRRGHSEEAVDRALERLRLSGYVDDRSYALRFARGRLRHQGLGRARIRAALRARGVEREILEEGLSAALGEVSEDQVLDGLACRYWEQHRRDPPARRLRKLWAFLIRRGFPGTLVAERLRALFFDRGEEIEGLSLAAEEGETA